MGNSKPKRARRVRRQARPKADPEALRRLMDWLKPEPAPSASEANGESPGLNSADLEATRPAKTPWRSVTARSAASERASP